MPTSSSSPRRSPPVILRRSPFPRRRRDARLSPEAPNAPRAGSADVRISRRSQRSPEAPPAQPTPLASRHAPRRAAISCQLSSIVIKKDLVPTVLAQRPTKVKVSHARRFIRRYPRAAPAAWTPAAHTLVAILPNTSHAAAVAPETRRPARSTPPSPWPPAEPSRWAPIPLATAPAPLAPQTLTPPRPAPSPPRTSSARGTAPTCARRWRVCRESQRPSLERF